MFCKAFAYIFLNIPMSDDQLQKTPTSPPSHTAVLIFNPGAGGSGGVEVETLLDMLRPAGGEIRSHALIEGEDAGEVAKQAVEEGAPWIAVVGGDGTVEAVAKALIGKDVPLGVIAAGTYNNFALSFGIPTDPLKAAELIRGGQVKAIDVGFVNGQPFLECVGAGLDAALFPLGDEIKEGQFLRWFTLMRRAWTYPKQQFELIFDRPVGEAVAPGQPRTRHLRKFHGKSLRISALMVTASNGPYYGMNFAVAPSARVDDGLITVSVFKRFSKLELWWHFFSISFGRRAYSPKTITFRVGSLEIRGPERLPTHRDGSPAEDWPLKVECRRGALKVFASDVIPPVS